MFRNFLLLPCSVLLSAFSFASHACYMSPIAEAEHRPFNSLGFEIEKECALTPYTTQMGELSESTPYLVQFIFVSDLEKFDAESEKLKDKIPYALSRQPYKNGYRIFIGPMTKPYAEAVLIQLQSLGYEDALIKTTKDSLSDQALSTSEKDSDTAAETPELTASEKEEAEFNQEPEQGSIFAQPSKKGCRLTRAAVTDEFVLSEDCQLSEYYADTKEVNSSSLFFVQYRFEASYQKYIDMKGDLQNHVNFPLSNQPYRYGFRMFVGPLAEDDIFYTLKRLRRLGFSDALIKFYTKDSHAPTNAQLAENLGMKEQIEMPTMQPVYTIGNEVALLPVYGNDYQGPVTQYNNLNIGNFTYGQAKTICHNMNGRMANEKDYTELLSDMDFIMNYAVKLQFWVSETETVTRIQNQIKHKTQPKTARFNTICITQ
ncbi:MAG: hypothetical protein ACK5NC_03765 [Vibrio sp.]